MIPQIEADFKNRVAEQISLLPDGKDRYYVQTPFRFDDGDHISVVLKQNGAGWILTDEGNTFMRLSYTIDEKELEHGTRRKVIESALAGFGVDEENGVLVRGIEDEAFGDGLFNFVQAVLHIADVTYLSRERVRSTFKEDLLRLVRQVVPSDKKEEDWHDKNSDPNGNYPADCRIDTAAVPLLLFAVQNDDKCHLSTIVILHYQRINLSFKSLAVFQNQEGIGRKPLARLTDVVDKQFSSLEPNAQNIAKYLSDLARVPNGKA